MTEQMTYLEALKHRGYSVTINRDGGLIVNPSPPPDLQQKIDRHADEIADDLWRESVDPRPDLVEDSELWTRLLRNAPDDLAGPLHGFRCVGARIERSVTGAAITVGDSAWWPNHSAFLADYKKYLLGDSSFTGRIDAPVNRALREIR